MTAHLCLSCHHARWKRSESGRLTGIGFCEAPDPELPELPVSKWWFPSSSVRGGSIYRKMQNPIGDCSFYEKVKR